MDCSRYFSISTGKIRYNTDGPKRKCLNIPSSWINDKVIGGVDIPVFANSTSEDEKEAINSKYVEKIRGPTTKMKFIK